MQHHVRALLVRRNSENDLRGMEETDAHGVVDATLSAASRASRGVAARHVPVQSSSKSSCSRNPSHEKCGGPYWGWAVC
jgi:hypothetical protein